MTRIIKMIPCVVIAVMISTVAMGAGTENNWKLSLQFKMGSKIDPLAIEVGTGTTEKEERKPPKVPGVTETGDIADANLRAAIITPNYTSDGEGRKSMISSVNKNIWAINVDADNSGQPVTLDIDTSNFFDQYFPISVVIPESDTPVRDIYTASQASDLNLFTADGVSRTVYLIAGASKSFAAAVGSKKEVLGVAYVAGLGRATNTEVKLFDSSCTGSAIKTVTTDANGIFTMDNVSDGTYVVLLDKPRHVGSECTISLDQSATSETSCKNMYTGDFNDDGKVSIIDITNLRPHYNVTQTSDPAAWESDHKIYDVNGDNKISISDISVFKNGYNTVEKKPKCGS